MSIRIGKLASQHFTLWIAGLNSQLLIKALTVFLDIKGVFDNTSNRWILSKLDEKGVSRSIVSLIANMLSS